MPAQAQNHVLRRQRWLLAAASGILQTVIFPNPSVSLLSWVALVPMLLAIVMADASGLPSLARSFGIAYISGVIWYTGSCHWVYHALHVYGNLPALASVGLLLLFSLFLAFHHSVFGLFLAVLARSPRIGPSRALVISPLFWVAVELARERITGFPWNLLGYSQIDNVPLTRMARWTGVYGLSFVVASVNAALAMAFVGPKSRRIQTLVLGLAAALLLQAGVLVHLPAFATDRKALLIQANLPILDTNWTQQYFDKTMADLSALTLKGAAAGLMEKDEPRLIVWPESPAPFYTADPNFRQWMSSLAMHTNSYLIVGSLGKAPAKGPGQAVPVFNSAVLISPEGVLAARYDKIHLVPFGEYVPAARLIMFASKLTRQVGDFSRGTVRVPLTVGKQGVGVFICYESIFPHEVRQFVASGGELLVNISNDEWFGESGAPRQHLNMARMRAIENDRWLLRATNTGITASIDPDGRIISQEKSGIRAALGVPYAFITRESFYTSHGDCFAVLCVIVAAIILSGNVVVGICRSWAS